MNDTELLNKIKLQNANRQKKYYQKNKDLINSKRREIYAKGVQEKPIAQNENQNEIVKHKTDFSKTKTITYEQTINALNSLDINEKTRNVYKDDLKRLITISNCNDDLISCFKNYETLIDIIENSKKNDGQPYAINTKKKIFQLILYLIDHLKLPIRQKIKQKYSNIFTNYKIHSYDVNKEKVMTAPVHTFDQYLEKIKDEFGEDSKMFVLSNLYNEVTARDDFILKIIPTIKQADDNNINYIVLTKKGNLTLILNAYKTSNKYGQLKIKLSSLLSKMIKKYIKTENLTYDNFLFGDKPLSSFVSLNNKKIGINDGINYYRHMATSDLLNTEPNADARRLLAEKMMHSPTTQLQYKRDNINDTFP